MLLDNSTLDFWWDEEVAPYLVKVNTAEHGISAEQIREHCHKDGWLVFKYPTLVFIGHIGLIESKSFYVNWMGGKGFYKYVRDFINHLNRSGIKAIIGDTTKGVSTVMNRALTNNSVLDAPIAVCMQREYTVDLANSRFKASSYEVRQLPQYNYENWIPTLTEVSCDRRGYIKNLAACGQALALQAGNTKMIGYISYHSTKIFNIVFLGGKITEQSLDSLLYFVELGLKCRYVSYTCTEDLTEFAELILRAKDWTDRCEYNINL